MTASVSVMPATARHPGNEVVPTLRTATIILAVTPWDLAWKQLVRLPGDRWR